MAMMGACWHCFWGWPKQIADIYDEAVDRCGGDDTPLLYGPAHIVWADENFEDDSPQWCLEHFDEYSDGRSKEDLAAVRWSLEELIKIPNDIRSEPEGYDGENPEKFPPPHGMVMVKR